MAFSGLVLWEVRFPDGSKVGFFYGGSEEVCAIGEGKSSILYFVSARICDKRMCMVGEKYCNIYPFIRILNANDFISFKMVRNDFGCVICN